MSDTKQRVYHTEIAVLGPQPGVRTPKTRTHAYPRAASRGSGFEAVCRRAARTAGRGPLAATHIIQNVDAPTAHRADAPASVRVFVLTISDTRTEATDTGGAVIVEALKSAGHTISGRKILKDDPESVAAAVRAATVSAEVVITTGGTGITSRDSTYEALARLFEKRLDGFGELFRMLSYEQVGAAAMLSRACAGTIRKTMVFALPGSEKAVRLALEKLILPELGHVVRELKR
jgi:molybdopterin adenylyltransferase